MVLTCGVGALAGTMTGAVIYGAAQGVAIGATVGVVGGGIVGCFAGASSFTANSAYISQYGGNVRKVLSYL